MTVPDGSAETFVGTDVIGWLALNMEHPIEKWATVVTKAQLRNIKVIPWVRMARLPENETIVHIKQRLQLLVDTARIWNTDWILPNYEDESRVIKPVEVKAALDATGWQKNTGWSMQAWLPNDGEFAPINSDPVLLQIFPADLKWPKDYATIKVKMGDCVKHARDHGFHYVGVTYQTYDDATPALFDVQSYQHSVYTGNLIQAHEWDDWFK